MFRAPRTGMRRRSRAIVRPASALLAEGAPLALELPGSLDEFLARKVNAGARPFGAMPVGWSAPTATTSFDVVRDRAKLDRLFADNKAIHRETYQHILGVGFSDEQVQRRLAELGADRGWSRGYMLYLRDNPVAFWHGYAYRGIFGIGATGFDPASPAIAPDVPAHAGDRRPLLDTLVHTLDFGFGDATYKRHFGDGFVEEEDVVVFGGSRAPSLLNALHTAFGGIHRRRPRGRRAHRLAHGAEAEAADGASRTGLLRSFLGSVLAPARRLRRRRPRGGPGGRPWARAHAVVRARRGRCPPRRGARGQAEVAGGQPASGRRSPTRAPELVPRALRRALLCASAGSPPPPSWRSRWSALLDRPSRTASVSATVEGRKQEVWDVLTDFAAYDEWYPFVRRASGEAREEARSSSRSCPRATSRSRSTPRF